MMSIKSQKTGETYHHDWKLGITKAPSGKDVATIKVINAECSITRPKEACLSKADLDNLIQHLKVLKKKMNNPDADEIEWPGCW